MWFDEPFAAIFTGMQWEWTAHGLNGVARGGHLPSHPIPPDIYYRTTTDVTPSPPANGLLLYLGLPNWASVSYGPISGGDFS